MVRSRTTTRTLHSALVAAAVGALAACTSSGPTASPTSSPASSPTVQSAAAASAQLDIDQPSALFDQPLHVTVSGLGAHAKVTISARATDADGKVWTSKADFTVDAGGMVDLERDAPLPLGSYKGVDGMGLFYSMLLPVRVPDDEYFPPPSVDSHPSLPMTLTVTAGGKQLAATTLDRRWMAPGETAKTLTLAADKVAGQLFLPPPGGGRRPAVLVFGGAEGGMSQTFTAALLAAHGYPALTVAYFDWPGLPSRLEKIPLEYFVNAGKLLAAQPSVDPAHLIVMGYSFGSEAALLLAQSYPDLFHGAVVYAPSNTVTPAPVPDGGDPWLLAGKPLPQIPVPLDRVSGPVLAIAGKSDALWDSSSAADTIGFDLDAAKSAYPHQSLSYDDAGHGVGTYPYLPVGVTALANLGGTREGNAAAQRDSWSKVLAMLGVAGR